MKAVRLHEKGGPQNLVIEEVETPTPGPGEVRVELKASALNRRDVWITLGKYPGISFPTPALGSDGAGVVDSVGQGVDESLIGKEVVVYPARDWGDDPRCGGANFRVLGLPDEGTFADYIVAPATDIVAKPAFLDWHQAAAIPLAGLTAWRALMTQAGLQRGESVLITGIGGGVSTFAMLWAVNHGASVYVTSSSNEKIAKAKSLGAADGINYKDEGWGKQAQKLTGGVDVVIDSTGGDAMHDYLDILKAGGRMVIYGGTAGNPQKGMNVPKFFFRQITLKGSTMGTPAEFATMMAFVESQKIEPVVDQVFPFSEVVAAHQHVLDANQMGKVVLNHGT
jgi:zinc-binding alcohol dehydrogenase/oxidoreductase